MIFDALKAPVTLPQYGVVLVALAAVWFIGNMQGRSWERTARAEADTLRKSANEYRVALMSARLENHERVAMPNDYLLALTKDAQRPS